MKSPEESSYQGASILTEWELVTQRLTDYAESFEAKQGMNWYEKYKIVPEKDQVLTKEEVEYNQKVDLWARQALEVVTHINELNAWYDAARRVRVSLIRTDY